MATLKALRIRIGSVSSSEKITGAMKMISSAKVHKNEMELKRLLPFRKQVDSIMGHLLATGLEFRSPLISKRDVKQAAIVVFGSDDGLCGAYNINIFKYLLTRIRALREEHPNAHITIIPVGKKIKNAVKKLELPYLTVEEPLEGVDSKMLPGKVNEFTEGLRENFSNGTFDQVQTVYMRYVSMSKQLPQTETLFPVSPEVKGEGEKEKKDDNKFYLFEPDPDSIFNEVLPMFVLSTMQEITIENRSSEQAARVMAMQSANDNAKKLLEELQLEYNKLRQQAITTELLDILGGQTER
ncbi:MAG: ATP synthase F1 subunit gamma [Muribaculaceae bacterium]|nr:ATP synthase F1 subunit gamma [Muribaculaceae bacterium]